jgi:hypothetical protein
VRTISHAWIRASLGRAQSRAYADAIACHDAAERCWAGAYAALAQPDPPGNGDPLGRCGDRVRHFDLDVAVHARGRHDRRGEARFERGRGARIRGRFELRGECERAGRAARREREYGDERARFASRERERQRANSREQRRAGIDPTAVCGKDAQRLCGDQRDQEMDGPNPARDRGVADRTVMRSLAHDSAPRPRTAAR